MEFRRFGNTQRKVSVIGQGTWNLERADRREAIAALKRGLELGMNHIDTAEIYGGGAVEALVGEALAGNRDEVFLVSKVAPGNATHAGTVAACEASLRRLRTDWLDCYLLHWREDVPLADTFAAFEQLHRDGKILSWGVSNFDLQDLEDAREAAGSTEGSLVCNQVLYHLNDRGIEHHVLPWCQRNDVAVVGYSPFGNGDFPEPRSTQGRLLHELAEQHRCTARQIALAFLIRRAPLLAIPKAARPAHTEENAGAATVRLSAVDLQRLDVAFPLGPARPIGMI
ncbi:MAG TPA: aldo/keto reductase [Polyangia bacterium]